MSVTCKEAYGVLLVAEAAVLTERVSEKVFKTS